MTNNRSFQDVVNAVKENDQHEFLTGGCDPEDIAREWIEAGEGDHVSEWAEAGVLSPETAARLRAAGFGPDDQVVRFLACLLNHPAIEIA